ncbi:hypothetical protein [Photobacterium kishitanii]|uniref:Uncharacterized protein n=1 Tax=Photobacterium kishitanii TaxID=318456 RepID=A0A2T3KMF8_9GAMM|nr:hypothetical protein [Photobacterium kishitanii]PSV00964.1 hypothetical protein C9J27_02765 [Photobacterium kishitanii]
MLKSPEEEFKKYLDENNKYAYKLSKIIDGEAYNYIKQHKFNIQTTKYDVVDNIKDIFFTVIDIINSCDYDLVEKLKAVTSKFDNTIKSLEIEKISFGSKLRKIPAIGRLLAYGEEDFLVRCRICNKVDLVDICNDLTDAQGSIAKMKKLYESKGKKFKALICDLNLLLLALESSLKESMSDNFFINDGVVENRMTDLERIRFEYLYELHLDIVGFSDFLKMEFIVLCGYLDSFWIEAESTAKKLFSRITNTIDCFNKITLGNIKSRDDLEKTLLPIDTYSSEMNSFIKNIEVLEIRIEDYVDSIEVMISKISSYFSPQQRIATKYKLSGN